MPSELQDWMEGIRRSGEESRAREDTLNCRLDKIILELEATDHAWYLKYSRGNEISFMLLSCNVTDRGKAQEIDKIKRDIVHQDIIPAMYACIRAGFVTPTDEAKT